MKPRRTPDPRSHPTRSRRFSPFALQSARWASWRDRWQRSGWRKLGGFSPQTTPKTSPQKTSQTIQGQPRSQTNLSPRGLNGFSNRFNNGFKKNWLSIGFFLLILWLSLRLLALPAAARAPIDAWLVLGGSIKREMYTASQARQTPDIPILISTGSNAPCIWAIFQREQVDLQRVWLEECARSTFTNFVYSVPVLKRWHSRHIKLITSPTHLPRALWMARIAFGLRGIWVDLDLTPEVGIPGNREAWLKTMLDTTRTTLWSIAAPLIPVRCHQVQNLAAIDWSTWSDRRITCEHQGQVKPSELPIPGAASESTH